MGRRELNGNQTSHQSGFGRLPPPELVRFLEEAPDGIAFFDERLRCLAVNAEFRRLIGAERGRGIEGTAWVDLFAELDRDAACEAAKTLQSSGRMRFEGDLLRSDGPVAPVEVTGIWRPTDFGWAQLHFRDVSERRRIDQLKDDFISVVNHELRTPLTSISGSLGLILGGVAGDVPERARSLAQVAHKNCQRLGRLINDMLDIQKIESGRVDFSFRPVELVGAVFGAVEAHRVYAKRFRVNIDVRSDVERAMVRADSDRIEQVVANLISNAAKYSPPGETVLVRLEETAPGFRVTVSDRGKGIPREFQSRVFAKFAQADTSTTRKKGGTGLGLAISKAIIEGMNGTIGFRTSDGEGTAFWFDLPSLVSTDEGMDAGGGPTVIVGDDSRSALPVDANMQTVGDGSEAFSVARTANVPVILVDVDEADPADVIASVRRLAELDEVSVKLCSVQESGLASLELAAWQDQPLDPGQLAAALRRIQARRGSGRLEALLVGSPDSVADVNAAILSALAECTVANGLTDALERILEVPELVLVLDSSELDYASLAAISNSALVTQASVVLVGPDTALAAVCDGIRAARARQTIED